MQQVTISESGVVYLPDTVVVEDVHYNEYSDYFTSVSSEISYISEAVDNANANIRTLTINMLWLTAVVGLVVGLMFVIVFKR